jgi:hypothetical protein
LSNKLELRIRLETLWKKYYNQVVRSSTLSRKIQLKRTPSLKIRDLNLETIPKEVQNSVNRKEATRKIIDKKSLIRNNVQ